MNFLTATIATATISIGSVAGCQPPSDQFQPGIPVVENSPIPVYSGATASQPATRTQCKVQARERDVPTVEDGCRLNLYMANDVIDGVSPEDRCLARGGTPRYLPNMINCVDVDL